MNDGQDERAPDPVAALQAEFVRIWRTGRAEVRRRAREIHPRLDPAGYQLMALLCEADAVPMAALLAEVGEEKSTLTRQVDALERLGLAERSPDPRDSRARLVSLTPVGRERFTQVRERTTARWRERFGQWPREDVETLTALLRRL